MVSWLINILTRFWLFILLFSLFTFFFWEYIKFFIYHLNLSFYLLFGSFFGENVAWFMTISILLFIIIYSYNKIKKIVKL